jgi:hypothetical protein
MSRKNEHLDGFLSHTDRLLELIKKEFASRWTGPVNFEDEGCQCTLVRDEADGCLNEARALLHTIWGTQVNAATLEIALEELIEDGLYYGCWPHACGDDALDAQREDDAYLEALRQDYENEQNERNQLRIDEHNRLFEDY